MLTNHAAGAKRSLGIIFRAGSTTGGTDIIVKILRKKFRYMKTGIISMLIDVVIPLPYFRRTVPNQSLQQTVSAK